MSETKRTARQKLDSLYTLLEMDRLFQFRAIVYARLLRKMIDAFGQDVLDIAENMRRENGRYSAETWIDAAGNETKYRESPGRLIQNVDDAYLLCCRAGILCDTKYLPWGYSTCSSSFSSLRLSAR